MQSWAFVIFVLASAALYWLAVPRRWRPHFLLAVSLGYYLACSLQVYGLTFIFLLFYLYGMFVIGVMIDTAKTKGGRRGWLLFGVLSATSILFIFKTTATITKVLFAMFGLAGGQIAALAFAKFGVPIGISYFSFRVIHYLVEVYRGNERRASALEFFLYVTFFPTMVSGPINRFFTIGRENPADSFGPQLRGAGGSPAFRWDDFSYGFWRILQGVVKKFVISDFFLRMAGPMMKPGMLMGTDWWQLWLAGHCYFVYLYIDFSGYSDMAIGMARLFGYRVMENFDWPLLAPNVREFWRRWHVSLTGWLTNYVYIPLGGGRKGSFRADLHILITIIAVALWHKVTVSMFIWGFIEGMAMIVFRHWERLKKRLYPDHRPTWWGKLIGIILVWHLHGLLWPLFHHKTTIALLYYAKMIPVIPLLKAISGQ
jgi:alginate O-acetyltransferase complex protein AlgI